MVGVLLGNGDGTFQEAVTYASGGDAATSVAIGDLDGDGNLDLAVANYGSSTIGVLLGSGDGTFGQAVSFSPGGLLPISIAIDDLNGDGHPDLILADYCQSDGNCGPGPGVSQVSVLLGIGNGIFEPATTYSSGGEYASSIAVGDVNGDGHPDVIVANQCQSNSNCSSGSGAVSVLVGNGDGTLQPPITYASGAKDGWSVAVADVNGDMKRDLIVTNLEHNSTKVGVLLNNLVASATTRLTSAPNPSVAGQAVDLTATITSNPPIPNREVVTFYNGAAKLGIGTTTDGIATLTTSFSMAGKYTTKASYPGDAFHKASSGTVKQVVVNP